MITSLFFIIIFLFLSAFFSGSEMAFISSNKWKIKELAEEGDPHALKILKMQEDPERLLTAILIGNNVAIVVATSILTYILEVHFGVRSEFVVAIIMTPIFLIFGEMLPKDYCRLRSEHVLHKYLFLLRFILKIFHYPTAFVLKMMKFVFSPLGSLQNKSIFVSEHEVRSLIEESVKTGVVDKHEKQMIDMILDFEKISTQSAMTPLDKVAKTEIHATVGDVKKIAARTKSRMVLVYEEVPEIVVGMIYVFDVLFEDDDDKKLSEFLRAPVFLQGAKSIESSFLSLQQHRQSYAVVTDSTGEAMGVVPVEKLLVYK